MSPSELKYQVERADLSTHFFDRSTMKFFGDTMANFGVRSTSLKIDEWVNDEYTGKTLVVEVWELYRKRPVKAGNTKPHYFDKVTFKEVRPACIGA